MQHFDETKVPFLPAVRALTPYVPGKPIDEVAREFGLSDIIKLASNENPYGASPKVQEALQTALLEIALYPDAAAFRLRSALAAHLGVTMAQIVVGNGSNELLELLARLVLAPGGNAVFSEKSFIVYALATAACGAQAHVAPAYPLDHAMPYGHDPQALLDAIDEKTRVVFIANPNNPTGTWWDKATWQNFLAQVPASVLVVYDEAYREYVTDAAYPEVLGDVARYPNLVVVRSFSKAYGLAALRLGYAVAHPTVADLLHRLRAPFNVNALAQIAGVAALEDQAFVQDSAARVCKERERMAAFWKEKGFLVLPSQGNFLTVHFGPRAGALHQAWLRTGVIVRPLANYGMDAFLRISIGTEAHHQRVQRTFEMLWQTL